MQIPLTHATSRSHGSLLLGVAVVVMLAACSTAARAQPSPQPAGTPSSRSLGPHPSLPASSKPSAPQAWTASEGGYTLKVTVDRTSVAPGEDVTFTVTFENRTANPIDYSVPWCGGAASVTMTVALPTGKPGKTWTGRAKEFKEFVLRSGLGPGGVPALAPVESEVRPSPCAEGQFEAILPPGDSVISRMAWTAEIVDGVPAIPGTARFGVAVGYDRQNARPSYPPDYKGLHGLWLPIYKQLTVTGTIDVVGEAPALVGPGEVIDAALADTTFARWLAAEPSRTWSGANLFLQSWPKNEGILPKGPSWELDLFKEAGVPRHWAIAIIDPFDASIQSITYCDVPCDR